MSQSIRCCDSDRSSACNRCLLVEHILGQRETLLAYARRRTRCAADAEDAVQEALTRALERVDSLDSERVDGWLKTVTVNICRDAARERNRHSQRILYQVRHTLSEPYVDEDVAERAYAASVAKHLAVLPAAQETVLKLRAEATPVDEIAGRLGITNKSVESLLSRGRRTMRAVASGLLAALLGGGLRARGPGRGGLRLAGGASVAAVTVLGSIAAIVVSGPVSVRPQSQTPPTATVVYDHARAHVQPIEPPDVPAHVRRPQHDSTTTTRARAAHQIEVGPVGLRSEGTSERKPHQTLMQQVVACVTGGVTISKVYVGCNSAE